MRGGLQELLTGSIHYRNKPCWFVQKYSFTEVHETSLLYPKRVALFLSYKSLQKTQKLAHRNSSPYFVSHSEEGILILVFVWEPTQVEKIQQKGRIVLLYETAVEKPCSAVGTEKRCKILSLGTKHWEGQVSCQLSGMKYMYVMKGCN